MKNSLYLFIIIVCCGCTNNSGTEKYQSKRNNIINVKEKLTEIVIDDVLIGRVAHTHTIEDYLIITNPYSFDEMICIFDKNNFNYITGTTIKGQGPGEIANMGHLVTDEVNRMFYVSDHGKQVIFAYHLDSVLTNPKYMPEIKMKMDNTIFPNEYRYFSDTLCIGSVVIPIGNSDFKQAVAKWNMTTGDIKQMKYNNLNIDKKHITFAVSQEYGIYVECFHRYDLMTICNLDGELKYNIYGPNWSKNERVPTRHYGRVIFCNNTIWATYSGENYHTDKSNQSKFFVFDINGNYIKTVEIGYEINNICFDKENNRIIMNLNSEMQFAYLDITGLIDTKGAGGN